VCRAAWLGSGALATAVINGLDIGVFLVDAALHLRLASKAATEMLRAADGLLIAQDRLACADRVTHRRLRQLVAMAADPDGPVGSLAVPRASGARPYLLTVMPLHDERAWLGTPRACALVLAIDPARCRPASAAYLRERYSLTDGEARTALALLEAERLRDVAERLGVSLPTVRTTLQRVFNKTDTHRQPELVWLLLAQGAAEDVAAPTGRTCSPGRPRRRAGQPHRAPTGSVVGRSTCPPTTVSRRR
jgi:DNA-binding CsgD family transcriptional regulator